MSSYIIGTCGHIDHGKTSIIKAMNGFEGDTLKEEKERGITIDLSFSNISRGDRNIAFIDVPGHEKLVKNMISGAFGFDSVMIVVSAAEGIKPQTVEHLEILKLLGVRDAILIISKKDLVSREELHSKIDEIQAFVAKYAFNIQAVLPVSIYDNISIEALKEKLFSLALKNREEEHFFRLYIDRVFSMKGQGCVVTGTVLGKEITPQEKLLVCDINKTCKIKNMQVHSQNAEIAKISHRVALNLANVDAKALKKGFLLSKKGYLRGFRNIDIAFSTLGENRKLRHNKNYAIYIGAKRFEAKVTLFDLTEGAEEGFATIKAEQDLFAVYGEKLIIRDANRTIAGATVLNPIADPLRKKQKLRLLEALEKQDFRSAYEVLLEAHRHGLGLVSSAQRFALSHEEALQQAKMLEDVFVDEKALVVYPLRTQGEIVETIRTIYEKNPYALLSEASLKLRLPWAGSAFIASAFQILTEEGLLKEEENLYSSTDVTEDLSTVLKTHILKRLEEEGFSPSAPNNIYDDLDVDRTYGDRILRSLCNRKRVIKLQHNLFIHTENLGKIVAEMRKIMQEEGYIDIRNFRERHALSRKYLVAYLEYLESFSDIVRERDKRVPLL